MNFTGFPKETFEFLGDLAANNSKQWFDMHRELYDEFYVEPARHFVEEIGPKLRALSKTVNFAPKINGSIFRIQRDVRFSKDKRPYKTHLDFWFWDGESRGWETPGYFLRLAPSSMMIGAGMHSFAAPQLVSYRAAVMDERSGRKLEQVLGGLKGLGAGGANRKTVPRGFDSSHPRARLLLHDGLYGSWEGDLPKTVNSGALVPECVERFREGVPIVQWLKDFVVKS
jgi:uncharacterized protein (TIGR02453 family)